MSTPACQSDCELRRVLQRHWGFDSLLPLQQDAMQCVLTGRDSVVVLPTGGGKSLCFQAPALCRPGLAVVVSPLISLMKDQVDGLRSCGVPAACIHSMLALDQRREVADEIRRGRLRLLYVVPNGCWLSGRSSSCAWWACRCLPWTKPIVSVRGAMTFGPNTASCAC